MWRQLATGGALLVCYGGLIAGVFAWGQKFPEWIQSFVGEALGGLGAPLAIVVNSICNRREGS